MIFVPTASPGCQGSWHVRLEVIATDWRVGILELASRCNLQELAIAKALVNQTNTGLWLVDVPLSSIHTVTLQWLYNGPTVSQRSLRGLTFKSDPTFNHFFKV